MTKKKKEEDNPKGLIGWICPVCGKGISPYKLECDCVKSYTPIPCEPDWKRIYPYPITTDPFYPYWTVIHPFTGGTTI